jgi:hypothetical protein
VTISADATDSSGIQKVDFYSDSILVGTDTSAPFTVNWDISNVPDGPHSLYVVATDTAGNSTTSPSISVTVDHLPPTVAMTNPVNGAAITGVINLAVNAFDSVGVQKVQYYRDSSILLGTSLSAPFDLSWDSTAVTQGSHTLFAVATDLAGNTQTSTVVNVSVDNTAPVVSLSAPANGAFVTGTLAVSATATDNVAISKVEFYRDDNVLLTTDTSSPYTFNWDSTTVTQGAHTLYAIAEDTTGLRTTSATMAITVDNTAPTVAITSPANGATVPRNTSVNINANASDNFGVVKVEFYVGTTLRCTVTSAPYTCVWQVPVQKGNFNLRATAYDVVGKTATHMISVSSK